MWGEEVEEQKQEKLVGQDKDLLVCERKKKKKSDAKVNNQHLPSADWCSASLWETDTL